MADEGAVDPGLQDETPLSKLLWQKKSKELKFQVRSLTALKNADSSQSINFVDLENDQPTKAQMVQTNESVFAVAARTAHLFGYQDVELVDLASELEIETDMELERMLAMHISWESACRGDVLEASLETIRSMLLSERPEPQTRGCFALWTLARDNANHIYVTRCG